MNKQIFISNIFLENEHIINFYIKAQIKFTIPYLTEALEHFECTVDELKEFFNNESFIEDFISRYHINIIELDYLNYESELY